jgi:hypothetical protein
MCIFGNGQKAMVMPTCSTITVREPGCQDETAGAGPAGKGPKMRGLFQFLLIYRKILPYLVEESRCNPFLLCLGFTIPIFDDTLISKKTANAA